MSELEAEAAAALEARRKEVEGGQAALEKAVAQKFASLEKQLDAKVGLGAGDGSVPVVRVGPVAI